jgi:hypothetical protein
MKKTSMEQNKGIKTYACGWHKSKLTWKRRKHRISYKLSVPEAFGRRKCGVLLSVFRSCWDIA